MATDLVLGTNNAMNTTDMKPEPGEAGTTQWASKVLDNIDFNWLGGTSPLGVIIGSDTRTNYTGASVTVTFSTTKSYGLDSFANTDYRTIVRLDTGLPASSFYGMTNPSNQTTTTFSVTPDLNFTNDNFTVYYIAIGIRLL